MTAYVVGDIQGCRRELDQLLEHLRFEPVRDRLILVGDLVNRGPDSVGVLRLLRSLGDSVTSVLGNHDLHLLAVAQRQETVGSKDTFDDVLQAPDRAELLAWLAACPLAYEEPRTGALIVHAGIAPQWDRKQVLALAQEAGSWIAGPEAGRFYAHMYGNKPDLWDDGLKGWDRIRFIVNCLTRVRYVSPDGRIDTKSKGAPGTQPKGYVPWFEAEGRRTAKDTVIFGHWSTLGRVTWQKGRVQGLDTGCVWGGKLTALNLETGELVGCGCEQQRKPGGD